MEQKRPITIGIDASRAFVKDPAGPEYYSWHLIQNLAKIDRKNQYLLYLRPNQKINFSLPQNFKTKVIYPNRFWTQFGLALETLFNPKDVLFIPAHTLPLLTRVIYRVGNSLKLLPQMTFLVTIHGLEGKYLPQSGSIWAHFHRNWSITWSVKFANHLITVSNDTYKDVLSTYKIDQNRMTVIHEGVDFEKFAKNEKSVEAIRKKYHITNNYILFVGTLQPRKNLVRLIEAFSIYINKKNDTNIDTKGKNASDKQKSKHLDYKPHNNNHPPKQLQLVIAGKPGWLYSEIMQAPKKFGIEDRVLFTGRVDDGCLPGLYKGAQAFVLPSLTEGFGLPILEAQATGTPVVSSNAGALREVAGDAAIFVNPRKTEELTTALAKILEDKSLRANLAQKGVKNAKSMSWRQTASSTLKLIERIAG